MLGSGGGPGPVESKAQTRTEETINSFDLCILLHRFDSNQACLHHQNNSLPSWVTATFASFSLGKKKTVKKPATLHETISQI